jgi:hypothetical protein
MNVFIQKTGAFIRQLFAASKKTSNNREEESWLGIG